MGSTVSPQHLCVTSQNSDPRASALLQSAHDLGITSLTKVDVADLVFFRGNIDANTKQLIESLLVDSLLQSGEWNVGVSTHQHVVETALRQKLAFIEVDEDLTLSASQIKAAHKMALGDAFCVATALANNAKILTGDPEIINAKGNWKVQDLR